MLPDLNRVRVFYYIFLHRSVAQAAKELHVTQSAVSQSLSKLEGELNQVLFTRAHKKLIPTSEAEELFKTVEPFFEVLQSNLEKIQQSQQIPRGLLKIGAPVEFGEKYLIKASAKFRNIHNKVRFLLEFAHPDSLLPKIKSGELDFAYVDIFSRQGEYSRETALFDIKPIFVEKLVLVCTAKYYDQSIKGNHNYQTLSQCSFISYQLHAPAIKSWFRYYFNKLSVPILPVLSVESVKGVIGAIREHLGLGVVPSYLIENEIRQGEMIVIKPESIDLINNISLVRLLDKIPNLTEKEFVKFFKESIDSAAEDSIENPPR